MHLKFPIFYAPDGATIGTIEAPGVSVPELPSAANDAHITDVDLPTGGLENIGPDSGVIGPKEILGESAEDAMDRADKEMGKEPRERGPDGKFLPKGVKAPEKPATSQSVKVSKPEAVKPVAKPVETKIEPKPEDKTLTELRAEIDALKQQIKPPEQKADTSAQEAQAAKELSEMRQAYIESQVARQDDITEKEHDTILAGGPEGLKMFRQVRARDKAELIEYITNNANKAFAALDKDIAPLREREKQIGEYQETNNLLNANPELKDHPKGLETYTRMKGEFETAATTIKAKGDQAPPQEKAWALQYEAMKPEERKAAIIANAKAELAKNPVVKLTNGTPAPAKPQLRVTKPVSGDRPTGNGTAPKQESKDSQVLREMESTGW